MKKKNKYPLVFKSENDLKKFLKHNKDFVLETLSENQFLWKDERYVCDSNILIFALRYAIGRKTAAVNRIVDWVLEEWERISMEERDFIVKEITEFEKNFGNLGYDWQRELWYKIVNKHLFGLIDELK